MTRKHFTAMAASIAAMPDRKAAEATAQTFARIAASHNPRLDLARIPLARRWQSLYSHR